MGREGSTVREQNRCWCEEPLQSKLFFLDHTSSQPHTLVVFSDVQTEHSGIVELSEAEAWAKTEGRWEVFGKGLGGPWEAGEVQPGRCLACQNVRALS